MKNLNLNLQIPSSQKGFTLIEVLVVAAIIGIISGIVFANFGAVKRARDSQRKADLHKIASALENYKADNGLYPIATSDKKIPRTCANSIMGNPDCTIIYLDKIPTDPLGSSWAWKGEYFYGSSDGSSYTLIACLENSNDPDKKLLASINPLNKCNTHFGYIISN